MNVFSYLETAQEIEQCACVSKFYQIAASEQALWKELAGRKYSSRVMEATITLYSGNYKTMVVDDNKLGALPTLKLETPFKCSSFRYNKSTYFFSSLVTCIRYDLQNKKLQLYIDARGERDLRPPWSSGISRQEVGGSPATTIPRNVTTAEAMQMVHPAYQFSPEVTCRAFQSLLPREQQGHYKGILEIDHDFFDTTGSYFFCYANGGRNALMQDYKSVHLFDVREGESLMDAFSLPITHDGGSASAQYYYTARDDSPFANDDEESEKERWRPYLPSDSFLSERSHWWVSD